MRSSVKVDVWNKALARIGQTEPIEDEEESRLAADVCRRHYDDCLEEALERKDWSFARRQARPARLEQARIGWAYTYALPADCISPRAILSGGQRYSLTASGARIPWETQDNDAGDGLVLCTDYLFEMYDALEYTARKEIIAGWPRHFLSAVAFRLAFELALAIPKDKQLAGEMSVAFEVDLAKAYANDLNARTPDQPLVPDSIRARD
jgi:hypothetical protein